MRESKVLQKQYFGVEKMRFINFGFLDTNGQEQKRTLYQMIFGYSYQEISTGLRNNSPAIEKLVAEKKADNDFGYKSQTSGGVILMEKKVGQADNWPLDGKFSCYVGL